MSSFQARMNSFQFKLVWNEFIPSLNEIILKTQDNDDYNDNGEDYDDDDVITTMIMMLMMMIIIW